MFEEYHELIMVFTQILFDGRHYNLINRYEASMSQMITDMFHFS
jgi:hypothetical protein